MWAHLVNLGYYITIGIESLYDVVNSQRFKMMYVYSVL